MKQWFIAVMVAFMVSGCSTLQVTVDSDPEFDFSTLSTFSVVYTNKEDGKDFTRSRIAKMLTQYFEQKGYAETEKEKADFYLMFHLDVKTKHQIETDYETMGLYPRMDYYYRRPYRPVGPPPPLYVDPYPLDGTMTVATTRTYDYEEGRLVVELLDVKHNAVVWQGIAVDELSNLPTAEAKSAYILKVLDKMFKAFPSKGEK